MSHFVAADIEPTPDFGGAIDACYLTGIAKAQSGVKMLVDLDRVWAADSAATWSPGYPRAPSGVRRTTASVSVSAISWRTAQIS